MASTTSPGRELTVGTTIGPWTRTTGLDNWNRFAAVNDEFVPIHMDDEAGRAAGMPGAFGPGNLLVSYLHAMVRDWLAAEGTLVSLSAQFRKPNTKGIVDGGGVVTSVDASDGSTVVELELWLKNAEGDLLAPGSAVVRFG